MGVGSTGIINVVVYFEDGSQPCKDVFGYLESLQTIIPHNLILVDIDKDETLKSTYISSIPVVEVGPYILKTDITKADLQAALGAANDRKNNLEKNGDPDYQKRVEQGRKITGTDKFSIWISKHYMFVFNFMVVLYLALPFLAPVFSKIQLPGPARVIYSLYSPLCHQLSFRSWFLFGEQTFYPRELAGIPGMITYEKLTGSKDINLTEARRFIGNEVAGYKVALCERDIAIYAAILFFGIIFSLTRNRIRPIPWYFWVVFGIIPIGLDGFSQLPSLLEYVLPIQFPIRESTPILRSITGGLFGWFTAWYLYPLVEETMQDTRLTVAKKQAYISQIITENKT